MVNGKVNGTIKVMNIAFNIVENGNYKKKSNRYEPIKIKII
jgi:hypothetical protein